jgi:hypothetical protein
VIECDRIITFDLSDSLVVDVCLRSSPKERRKTAAEGVIELTGKSVLIGGHDGSASIGQG